MRRTHTAITLVVVMLGSLVSANIALAQAPPPTPAPPTAIIDAEPESQSHVVTTGAEIVATVTNAGVPVANAQVFWTEAGPGEFAQADAATNADGQATAIVTSRQATSPGPPAAPQLVTAWLDPPAGTCAPPAPTGGRCDEVSVTWVARPSPNQPALECSGGAFGVLADPVIGPVAEVPNAEEPCPEAGTPSDPTVRRETVLDVPASPLVFVGLADARSEFASDHSESTARVEGTEVGGTLGVEVAGARATSECSPNGIATQELDGGQVVITDTMGTPDDPSDDEIVFSGIAPPNTEIPLDPLTTITLNEQMPAEGGSVGPELPGEVQDRHAEGSVNAVHIQSPTGDIILGHAESDITCKQHAFAIDLEPEDQTAALNGQATVTATVTDEAGRPVPNEDVTWTESGPGSFQSTQPVTDTNGQANAVVTSPDPGDQFITATLSDATTKCSIATGGICFDTVVVHWQGGPTGADQLRVLGHAHTDYDGDGKVHLSKNDRGDVHIGANLVDDLTNPAGPTGRLGYWDLRPNPPGPMQDEFRCHQLRADSITRIPGPANVVQIDGPVVRCNKSQRDPSFTRYRIFIRDNGPNPPNADGYHMIFFGSGGTVRYDWEDTTTVGLGNLTIEEV
ncbi:MAG: choice-of-anchor P family protein [Actinomycetota bacterium]